MVINKEDNMNRKQRRIAQSKKRGDFVFGKISERMQTKWK
tara:strand:+ start:112 stop:231 length:120 start_codon:yes stop_codon:yes gene_type:complete